MSRYLTGRFFYMTDTGKVRLSNEDQAIALTNASGNVLLMVCDGMGGQNKGDLASSLAVNTVVNSFINKKGFINTFFAKIWVSNIISEANKSIYEQAQSNPVYKGMGTTMTLLLIIKDVAILGHVGDSRCYFLKNNRDLVQMSEDQTYVAYLLRTGQITPEEALTHPKRHVLMNALGIYPSANIELKSFPYTDEKVLLCSDGLFNNVPIEDIASIVRGDDTIEQKVNELIAISNKNGGSDNIAIVLWEAQT
ncbi:MAG TPA: Stp1/IreP family PP2C-type Ser/Thr phosphatase [Erysipelotrichaceae bacterium]|nr:Stp1/IreP family PP2C-type Ser/Thr phosphatase [Erysipelotrichaceae bacterium]